MLKKQVCALHVYIHSKAIKQCHLYGDISGLPPLPENPVPALLGRKNTVQLCCEICWP
jgi:hypothetical protein